MARLSILFHPPATRVFAAKDGKALAYDVERIVLGPAEIESGHANHSLRAVPEIGAEIAADGSHVVLPYGDLHLDAETALREGAVRAETGRCSPPVETQASVVQWTGANYPEEAGDRHEKIMNLVEEVAELATESGIDPERSAEHFRRSAVRDRSGDPEEAVKGEFGDVGIAFYDAAEAHGLDADRCRDLKMARNRLVSPEESASRKAAKKEKGL
jgi:hypothetical protein